MPLNNFDNPLSHLLKNLTSVQMEIFTAEAAPILFGESNGTRKEFCIFGDQSIQISFSGFVPGPEGSQVFQHLLRAVKYTAPWEEYSFRLSVLIQEMRLADPLIILSRLNALQRTVITLSIKSADGNDQRGMFPLLDSVRQFDDEVYFEMAFETVLMFADWAEAKGGKA